jgi:type III pantothenate kinase
MKKGRIPLETVHDILISSVVPRVDRSLCKDLKALFSLTPRFVSASSPSKIKIHYKSPSEVGADRLVNARAAWALHKGPSIVIDFGTATTFDCISGKGEYLGGVIAPGPVISAEALYQKTAKLPFVLLEKPVQILGRNTLESIQAGLYYGYRGLVQEITLQLKRQLGGNPKVFATGGQAHWILKGVKIVDAFVPHLTHLGIYFYWQDGQKEI